MSKKVKTLCDWDKKEIDKKSDELLKIILNPKFYCKKCARSAHSEEYLCKSKKIDKSN